MFWPVVKEMFKYIQFSKVILNLDPVVQALTYFKLWPPLCSAKQNCVQFW